jgi:hypothetical protein
MKPSQDNEMRHCPHGGGAYRVIGETFRKESDLNQVLAADVLDAWYPPAPQVVQEIHERLSWLMRTSPPLPGTVDTENERDSVRNHCSALQSTMENSHRTLWNRWLTTLPTTGSLEPQKGDNFATS